MKIDSTWTLFLDRDGVINTKLPGAYVASWEQFSFIDGVKESLIRLAEKFNRIIIVTNQQGIGKGIMTEKELAVVHKKMVKEISLAGGRIDKIYHCPDLAESGSICRKPETGMALVARAEFPEIVFSKSIMVGDALSDMEFGRRCGMFTVYIGRNSPETKKNSHLIDMSFKNLNDFCASVNIIE
ncbi:MAG: HAD family hydrolase [Bacteroidota bacterium]